MKSRSALPGGSLKSSRCGPTPSGVGPRRSFCWRRVRLPSIHVPGEMPLGVRFAVVAVSQFTTSSRSMIMRNCSIHFAKTRFFLAFACVVAAVTFSARQAWANGTPDYFDVNGSAAGFGTPTLSGTYNLSGSYWTPSSSGTSATGTLPGGSQLTFGNLPSDFSGSRFTINADASIGSFPMAGLLISSSNANITIGGNSNLYLSGSQTWTVAAGSTPNESVDYNGVALNFNNAPLTLAGGGTINFNTALGFNMNSGSVTEDGSGRAVNLNTAGLTSAPYSGGYTLTQGVLNFAATSAQTLFTPSPTARSP